MCLEVYSDLGIWSIHSEVKLKQDLSSKSKVIQLKSLKYWIWNILLQAHEPSLGWYNTCLFLKIIISEIYIDENKNVYFWKGKIQLNMVFHPLRVPCNTLNYNWIKNGQWHFPLQRHEPYIDWAPILWSSLGYQIIYYLTQHQL